MLDVGAFWKEVWITAQPGEFKDKSDIQARRRKKERRRNKYLINQLLFKGGKWGAGESWGRELPF